MAGKNSKFQFWDFDEYAELRGELIGRYPSIGKFNRAVFIFRRKGGGVVHVWSWVQVHALLNGVPFGTDLILKYHGMKEMPDKKGRMFKDFSVEVISPPKNEKAKS